MSFDTRDQQAVKDLATAQKELDVIGLKAVTGAVVPRLDIDDFILKYESCFNLFLLALRDLQAVSSKDDQMGYYRIAGIHGMPRVGWNESTLADKRSLPDFTGYCAHSMDIFSTWHRPYLALLEQTIYSKMVDIAKKWMPESERQAQVQSTKDFRLPYWDYWKPRGGRVVFPGVRDGLVTDFPYDFRVPDILVAKSVMVREPEKSGWVAIDNPLASFSFPESESRWWQAGERTSRHPTASPSVTTLNLVVNRNRESLNNNFLNMLNDPPYENFSGFSTNAWAFGGGLKSQMLEGLRPTGSLEDIHNQYHNHIGGGGTMNYSGMAAFDPIFWIHHCQIDRLLAIWQATHPNAWFESREAAKDANLPLRPFTKGGKNFWTSNEVRKTEVFGYTYPDISKGQDGASIKKQYSDKYQWATPKGRGREPPEEMKPKPVFHTARVFKYDKRTQAEIEAEANPTRSGALAEALRSKPVDKVPKITTTQSAAAPQIFQSLVAVPEVQLTENRVFAKLAPSKLVNDDPNAIDEANSRRTWYVDNRVEKLALNGPFTIYFFVGDLDDTQVALYDVAPSLAGLTYNFASPVEYCDNCGRQDDQGQLVSGTVLITPILEDYVQIGQLADLTPAAVEPFLVKHLRWRVVSATGEKIDPRVLPGLKLGVSCKIRNTITGEVKYQDFNGIIDQVLQGAS